MKVLRGTVVREMYPTKYRLHIHVDQIPEAKGLRYTKRDGIYWAEKDGYVSFFHWVGPGNEGGFGGAEFPITLADGTTVVLRGPWSSNPTYANGLGFPHSADVVLTESTRPFSRLAGHITVDLARECLSRFAPHYLLVESAPGVYEIGVQQAGRSMGSAGIAGR